MTLKEFEDLAASFPSGKLIIYIVLKEDVYETKFGDGYYAYFDNAFFSLKETVEYVNKKESETDQFVEYHIRETDVSLENYELTFLSNFNHFDRLSKNEVIESLKK